MKYSPIIVSLFSLVFSTVINIPDEYTTIQGGIDDGSFRLQPGRPCIDAGSPDSPLDPDCSPADIGAYYFNQCGIPGDINQDMILNVMDIVVIVECIVTGSNECYCADMNDDCDISVLDIVRIVLDILEG